MNAQGISGRIRRRAGTVFLLVLFSWFAPGCFYGHPVVGILPREPDSDDDLSLFLFLFLAGGSTSSVVFPDRISVSLNSHVLFVLANGSVRAWGDGSNGRLGYDDTAIVGNGIGNSIIVEGDINGDAKALAMFETIRAHGAMRMGLIDTIEQAAARQHTPKVAFVAAPMGYTSSSGKSIAANAIDLNVRALSMGKLHHAMMGTAAVAIGTAAAIPGTLVNLAAGGGDHDSVTFGHPSGTLKVGAAASRHGDDWVVDKVVMSRSARVLMEGRVRVPGDVIDVS